MSDVDQKAINAAADKIVQPLHTAGYSVDWLWKDILEPLDDFLSNKGKQLLEYVPDFQRGHVWTEDQQRKFVEGVLRGVVGRDLLNIRFNCAAWNDDPSGDLDDRVQCIDGLQRLTAIRNYVAGEIKPFGLSVEQLAPTHYGIKRASFSIKLSVYDFQNRADLLKFYLAINDGGTVHSAAELTRVRGLLAEVQPSG